METIQLFSGSFPATIKDVISSLVGLLKQVHLSWSSGLIQILNWLLKLSNKSPVIDHISFSGSAGVAVLSKAHMKDFRGGDAKTMTMWVGWNHSSLRVVP